MLLFGTLGNNSRRKVDVVKLLILKYYIQFVVPITFMIGIRRKLSSILVKNLSRYPNQVTCGHPPDRASANRTAERGPCTGNHWRALILFHYVNFVVFRELFLSIKITYFWHLDVTWNNPKPFSRSNTQNRVKNQTWTDLYAKSYFQLHNDNTINLILYQHMILI